MSRSLSHILLGFLLAAVLFITTSVLIAWAGPTVAPPNGNVEAPINVGTADQIKNAGLGINSLGVFGNAIISGADRYLNFGMVPGNTGYGIRDNNGVIEFKNSGGSWQPIASSAMMSSGPGVQMLHNDIHTDVQCEAAGGLVRSAGGGSLVCEFTASSCPAGWTGLENWGSTAANTCTSVRTCTTGSHAYSNVAAETCQYCTNGRQVSLQGFQCFSYGTCTAIQQTVGCY